MTYLSRRFPVFAAAALAAVLFALPALANNSHHRGKTFRSSNFSYQRAYPHHHGNHFRFNKGHTFNRGRTYGFHNPRHARYNRSFNRGYHHPDRRFRSYSYRPSYGYYDRNTLYYRNGGFKTYQPTRNAYILRNPLIYPDRPRINLKRDRHHYWNVVE